MTARRISQLYHAYYGMGVIDYCGLDSWEVNDGYERQISYLLLSADLDTEIECGASASRAGSKPIINSTIMASAAFAAGAKGMANAPRANSWPFAPGNWEARAD